MNEETNTTRALVPASDSDEIQAQIARSANEVHSRHLLKDYHDGLSKETLRRHLWDLRLFVEFLDETLPSAWPRAEDLLSDLHNWHNMSHGLVEAFKAWQQQKGYALSSVWVRVSTVKVYCRLAHAARIIGSDEYVAIRDIKGYKGQQAVHVDEKRPVKGIGLKKEQWISISSDRAGMLKKAPVGRLAERDRLLICLLLDHAMRVGEVAVLPTSGINLQEGKLHYYRPKINEWQTDNLTPDTLEAAMRYLPTIPEEQLSLFDGLSTRALAKRVEKLGEKVGLTHFSPHDYRHFFAEDAIRNGSDLKTLRDAGGWKTLEMPARYAGRQKISNQGIRLSAIPRKENE